MPPLHLWKNDGSSCYDLIMKGHNVLGVASVVLALLLCVLHVDYVGTQCVSCGKCCVSIIALCAAC